MTLEELQVKIRRWQKVGPESLKVTLTRAAEMVREEAQRNHFRLPKMPRGMSGGMFGSWLGSSEPRHPFHLRDSIAHDVRVTANELRARVGTNVEYARRHEFGTHGMPARPYLRPSLAKKHDRIFEMIERDWMAAYGK